MLLAGPPGVGKTTIAIAIAKDAGWNIVELNASEERNAAIIRKSATSGATHYSLDSFNSEGTSERTLILLDEVDHLSGGFSTTTESTIKQTLDGDSETAPMSGDRGGKGELLRLLSTTEQPVMMTCNDPMRLWSPMRNWRRNRDRILRSCEMVVFDRVSHTSLERIARRILKSEDIKIDPAALDCLIRGNPGDVRALVKDLQALATVEIKHIDMEAVRQQLELGSRDEQVDVFNGLREMLGTRIASKAMKLGRELDKDPNELIAWVAWNMANNHSETKIHERTSKALSSADAALAVTFTNRAYRAWLWGGAIASLTTCSIAPQPPERIHIGYPEFLRRRAEPWRSGDLMNRIAAMSGSSLSAVREELWPILLASHDQQLSGDPMDCTIAWALDLEAEDHLALHGLASKNILSKKIIEKFNRGRPIQIIEEFQIKDQSNIDRTDDENNSINSGIEDTNSEVDDENGQDESQTTLDLF
jgi:replication factor C large subunit